MSLLLDALKRAEQEKLTRQGDRPPGAEPRTAPPSTPTTAAVLELQPLPGTASAAPRGDAQAAQAVFRAKAAQEAPRNRRVLWAAAGAIVLVVAAAGAYLWHSLRSLAPRAPAIAAIRPAPIAPPSAQANGAKAAAPEAQSAAPQLAMVSPGAAPSRPDPEPSAPPEPLDELLRRAQPAAPPPVRLARTEDPKPRVPRDVQLGYRALLAGDLDAARRDYSAALESDPADLDAQLGLATVEARAGNVPSAAAAYRRALELDPQNATAVAGLAALADDSRPEALENGLRGEIARHPDSAALQLTLGNLLAAQGRWAEAQAAYFDAQRLQPENADVAYNLAVSLDHLGQRRAAADFYRRALAARASEAAQFDAAAASRRLAELSR